ncbi:nucleotide-binding universal stress UspA family protein [Neobacillus ginsengisoli]|uniref:Nucleotide-binding universal stress UspA family protein n=1 Tax=Neobacillus ginsengisoli TaxID=904295 RepID=A0ABT9Y0S3_9BACI|nr:nucleotide-binding universal stress UspA family protein [Neobacillus ginsengisoli]
MFPVCSRIVVPYDNSELSKKALETAMMLAIVF